MYIQVPILKGVVTDNVANLKNTMIHRDRVVNIKYYTVPSFYPDGSWRVGSGVSTIIIQCNNIW